MAPSASIWEPTFLPCLPAYHAAFFSIAVRDQGRISSRWPAPPAHLIAALAALVSVYMIVLDEIPPVIWNVAIGFWWMLGVLLQLAAGTAARLGQFTGAAGQARSDAKRV